MVGDAYFPKLAESGKYPSPTAHEISFSPLRARATRGTVRITIGIGFWAFKVARNATGHHCNRFEADLLGDRLLWRLGYRPHL
jgi:hypothetical protein